MTFIVDTVTLISKTASTVTPSSDLPISLTKTTVGDLTPWRIRLELTNTGESGVDNSGRLTLRLDEKKTFIKIGPLLLQEDAKDKYYIQIKLTQNFPDGTSVDGKLYRFQLGTVTIDVDERNGSIISLTLQEIQYSAREAFTSNEMRFVTPQQALHKRHIDFNFVQPSGVSIVLANNNLPVAPELEYVPQSPISLKKSFDEIFENLSQPEVLGGVFTDYYYDFDPDVLNTHITNMTADEIGKDNTGITLDPESENVIESNQEESASTDLLRYKNHVIFRGSPTGGSLPREHSVYSSQWEHAKQRSLFDNLRQVQDGYGNTKKYLKGETCKRSFVVGAIGTPNVYPYAPSVTITRFFKATTDVTTINNSAPELNPNFWQEDFVTVPKFDKTGHYKTGDIVYYNTGGYNVFYRAVRDIFDWSLGRYREWNNGSRPYKISDIYTGSALDNSTGFLKNPTSSDSKWSSISLEIPSHITGTSFVEYVGFSPWTSNIFDWEKNMIGLSGQLPYGTNVTPDDNGDLTNNNRYVGLTPDWNMCTDTYEQQDALDEFETISVKWVHAILNAPPTDPELIYHGQRILVGTSGSGYFAGQSNKLAQYDKNKSGSNKWQFSASPVAGDIIVNMHDGFVYQHNGTVWQEAWRVEGNQNGRLASDRGNPLSPAAPCHLVKDIYKTTGFEGTPNSAIEFRYIFDTEQIGIASSGDSSDTKSFLARLNSRGAWLWFWFPFPRLSHSSNGSVEVGEKYGGNGESISSSGFTTLNTNNLTSNRKQSMAGWNNGLDSEDLGKINSISFKLKVGIFASYIKPWNDDQFWELPDGTNGKSATLQTESELVTGLEKVPMVFWCVDMFDRIWYKTFSLRRNGRWDDVTIQFGDMSQQNMYFPRWGELSSFLGIPLSETKFALKQKEYTGVAFDWRFVRGWGLQYMGSYDDMGFYNGGIDGWQDTITQTGQTIANIAYNVVAVSSKFIEDVGANWWTIDTVKKLPNAYSVQRQATIAIDDLHFKKELYVNSDDVIVNDGRTTILQGNTDDYLTGKALARGERERLSFFPQYWHIRAVGDVRMRIGKSFNVKGDRIPEHPDLYTSWSSGTTYANNAKVKYNGFTYMSKSDSNQGNTPIDTNDGYWENLNRLACATVTHILDHTGYHMEIVARRRFRL